nr:hypothetical protein [Tanacetum cinerariifolium]
FSDEYLLTTLKTMFQKPDGQDAVWKSQRSVHGQALVKRYPLSKFTLEQLVNVTRLQVEEESEMSLKLLSFGSTIKLVSFDKGQVVTHNGKFVYGFRDRDCGIGSQSDNTVDSTYGFIIHWIIISKNIKNVTEVIDVKKWRIDNSRVLGGFFL